MTRERRTLADQRRDILAAAARYGHTVTERDGFLRCHDKTGAVVATFSWAPASLRFMDGPEDVLSGFPGAVVITCD